MGYFCPPLVSLGFLSRWQKYLSYTLKHMLSKMPGAVLHFTLPCNTAPRHQWKKASHHCWVPSSNTLKLKGFTNSFKNWQRLAPNAGSPFPRDNMQKLFALENNFLRGKKEPSTCFLLKAAVVFVAQSMCKKWSWLCWDVAWSCHLHLNCMKKFSVTTWILVCKTHCRHLSGWLWSRRAPGVLHYVPPAYPNAMRHPNPCTCNTCTLNPGFVCTCANLNIKKPHFWNNPWWQGKQGNCF